MISRFTRAYMPTGLEKRDCWTGTGAIGRMGFYEWYHVGVSQPLSLFMASRVTQTGSHGLCLSTVPREYGYTCSTFQGCFVSCASSSTTFNWGLLSDWPPPQLEESSFLFSLFSDCYSKLIWFVLDWAINQNTIKTEIFPSAISRLRKQQFFNRGKCVTKQHYNELLWWCGDKNEIIGNWWWQCICYWVCWNM